MKNWLTVGEFAKQARLTARAVRLYEKLGLLTSVARGENGYRYFRESEVAVALRIGELRALGFSLDEVARLLAAGFSEPLMRQRLATISCEVARLNEQRVRIENILSSKTLNGEERKFVMSLVKTVLVTGCEDLSETASAIRRYLTQLGVAANVVVTREAELVRTPDRHAARPQRTRAAQSKRAPANPDIIVIRNLCNVGAYLPLYENVSPETATVLNADDMLSIELAKNKCVQAGKIFYYSKNAGVAEQIRKIGGVVSDGEVVEFCGPRPAQLKLPRIMAHSEEVALIAALGGLIDFNIEIQKLAL